VFLVAMEELAHGGDVFEQKQVAAVARVVAPFVPVGAVTITRAGFAYEATIEHKRQSFIEPLGNVVGRPPPADATQQFDMTHFMGDHVDVHALRIQDDVRTAPGRADAAPGAFGAAAIFLILLRCLANDDFGPGNLPLVK